MTTATTERQPELAGASARRNRRVSGGTTELRDALCPVYAKTF